MRTVGAAPTTGAPRWRRLHVALLLVLWPALFVVQGRSFIGHNGATVDEALNLVSGLSYLERRDFRMNREHPPLAKLIAALPAAITHDVPFAPPEEHWQRLATIDHIPQEEALALDLLDAPGFPRHSLLAAGRHGILATGTLLVLLLGLFAHRLFGSLRAAHVAMALAAFEPNLLAHSCLVTTDVPVTTFLVVFCYGLWEYHRRPTWRWLVLAGLGAGLACASKYTAAFILPVAFLGATMVLYGNGQPWGWPSTRAARTATAGAVRALAVAGTITTVAGLTVTACYLGRSPAPWLQGLGVALEHQQSGHPSFLLGEHSAAGWWYYFPLAVAFKVPPATLALALVSLAALARPEPHRRALVAFVVGPATVVLGGMMASRIDIGVRYVLPCIPLLLLLGSRLAVVPIARWPAHRVLPTVAVLATAYGSLSVAPHQLSYFSEAFGGQRRGYQLLGDSNLDWGQTLPAIGRYAATHRWPPFYLSCFGNGRLADVGIRAQTLPDTGPAGTALVPVDPDGPKYLVVTATMYQGMHSGGGVRAWLRERAPDQVVAGAALVFDLTGDPAALAAIGHRYLAARQTELARRQLAVVTALAPQHPATAALERAMAAR